MKEKIKRLLDYIIPFAFAAVVTYFFSYKFYIDNTIYIAFYFVSVFIVFYIAYQYALGRNLSVTKERSLSNNARLIIDRLVENGILKVSIEDMAVTWKESGGKVEVDMDTISEIWKDKIFIEVEERGEEAFKNDDSRAFFKILSQYIDPDILTDASPDTLQVRLTYQIALLLIKKLDRDGHCPSVVQVSQTKGKRGSKNSTIRSEEPDWYKAEKVVEYLEPGTGHVDGRKKGGDKDNNNGGGDENKKGDKGVKTKSISDYELLSFINLRTHSFGVANKIIDMVREDDDGGSNKLLLLPAIISALAHDIGKDPNLYDSMTYTSYVHPHISEMFLSKLIAMHERRLGITMNKNKKNIILFAIRNHHVAMIDKKDFPSQNAGKLLEFLRKADQSERQEEVRKVLREMGYMSGERELDENVDKNVNSLFDKGKKMEKGINGLLNQDDNAPQKTDEQKEEEEPLKSEQNNNENEESSQEEQPKQDDVTQHEEEHNISDSEPELGQDEGLEEEDVILIDPPPNRKPMRTNVILKYPDLDQYLKFKPVDADKQIEFKPSEYEVFWLDDKDTIFKTLEVVEERINYVRYINGSPIYHCFNIKDTLFVTGNLSWAIVSYFSLQSGMKDVLNFGKATRRGLITALVNKWRDYGIVDDNIKQNFFIGNFIIYQRDFNSNEEKPMPGKYTTFYLSKIAEIFNKEPSEYEHRKDDLGYDENRFLRKFSRFEWDTEKKT